MQVINFLKSPVATLIVLCSALLAQLPHAADVFRMIVMGSDDLARWHSYTYAIALELAVLLFVVQRRNVESYIFAGVSILVNLSYYYLHGVDLRSNAAAPAWLVSIALPVAIAQYSHLIAAATEQAQTGKDKQPATVSRSRWQFWKKPLERPATDVRPIKSAATPVALPGVTLGHSDASTAAEQTGETGVLAPSAKPTKEQRRAQIVASGLQSSLQVQQTFGVGKRTADEDLAWVRKNLLQTNGAQHQ